MRPLTLPVEQLFILWSVIFERPIFYFDNCSKLTWYRNDNFRSGAIRSVTPHTGTAIYRLLPIQRARAEQVAVEHVWAVPDSPRRIYSLFPYSDCCINWRLNLWVLNISFVPFLHTFPHISSGVKGHTLSLFSSHASTHESSVCAVVGGVWSVICYMKHRWRREEEETRQMYDMVQRIIGKKSAIAPHHGCPLKHSDSTQHIMLCIFFPCFPPSFSLTGFFFPQMCWGATARLAKRTRICSPSCPFPMSETPLSPPKTGQYMLP